ncbi:MAG: HlyD family secretion protein, partial [Spirochaetota bacterium]
MQKRIIISVFMIALAGCGGTPSRDASGTFEATEVVVSAEAAGRLVEFSVEEGKDLAEGQIVGRIDDIQLSLKRRQLAASLDAALARRSDVGTQTAAIRQQIATAVKEKARIEKLLAANAANHKQLDDIIAQISFLEKQLAAQSSVLETGNRVVTDESAAVRMQIAQIDDQLVRTGIKSPIKGTVLVKYAEKGELASLGRPLFRIADTQRVIL